MLVSGTEQFLRPVPLLTLSDGGVGILPILLWQHIAAVFLIPQNVANGSLLPIVHTLRRAYPLLRERLCNFPRRSTFYKSIEDIQHDFQFCRLDFDPAGIVSIVADGVLYREFVQTLLHSLTDALFDCNALLLTFQFPQGRQNRYNQFVLPSLVLIPSDSKFTVTGGFRLLSVRSVVSISTIYDQSG